MNTFAVTSDKALMSEYLQKRYVTVTTGGERDSLQIDFKTVVLITHTVSNHSHDIYFSNGHKETVTVSGTTTKATGTSSGFSSRNLAEAMDKYLQFLRDHPEFLNIQ